MVKYHHGCGWHYQLHLIPFDEIGFILLTHLSHLKKQSPYTDT